MKKIALILLFMLVQISLFAQYTNYYAKPTGSITSLATWGTNTNGTGSSPASFNGNYCRYYLFNRSASLNGVGNLIIGGANSVLVIGNGITYAGITIPNGYLLKVDSLYLDSICSILIKGTAECPKAAFSYYSSVYYEDTSAMQPIMGGSYGKIFLAGIPTTSMWNDTRTKILKGDVQAKNYIKLDCILYCDTFSLTIGTSPSQIGYLYYDDTNYWGRAIGKVKRWIPTTSNNECLFPLGSPNKKHQLLYITSTSAPTVGGLLSVEYLPYFAGTAGLPLVDTSSNLNLNRIHSGFYNISIENGLTGGAYNIKAMPLDIGNVNWEGALRMLKRDGVSNNWRLEPGSFGGGHSAYIPSIGIYGTSSLNGQYVIASDSNINTLPIQLTQLKGAYEAEQISLYWTTVSEVNAKEFVVSVLDQTEWKVMQKIGAFGNSSQIRNYHSRFNYASKDGKVTLKLEAFDRDGSNSISKQITLENNQKLPDISLYPNPFSEELQVQYFGSNQSAFADIFIYDETGKLVQQNQIYFTTNQTQIINVGELSPGFYLIKVTKEGRTHFYRQVKL